MAEKAGKLEVDVVADTTGLAAELRRKVAEAAEGVAAKIGVEVDSTGLRTRLRAAVSAASKGLTAQVGMTVDRKQVRDAVDSLVREVSSQVLTVPVELGGTLRDDVRNAVNQGQAQASRDPIDVPLEPDRKGGFLARLRARRQAAQVEADANPIDIPVRVKTPRGRTLLRGSVILGILSLLQPLVALIGALAGGLTAVAGAGGAAVGVLGALPGLVGLLVQAFAGVIAGFKGVGGAYSAYASALDKLQSGVALTQEDLVALDAALRNISPSARTAVLGIAGLRDRFKELRQNVQESLFKPFADSLAPVVGRLLPTLNDGLSRTGSVIGGVIKDLLAFADTPVFRANLAKILGSNNRALESIGRAVVPLTNAFVNLLVASGPFIERIARGVETLALAIDKATASGRATGAIGEFLEYAGDKFAQLARILGDIGSIFGSVFKAGREEGDRLLLVFETFVDKVAKRLATPEGQAKLKEFFAVTGANFEEFVKLLGAIGGALGRLSADPNLKNLLKKIKEDLVPALEALLAVLGQSLGEPVIDLLTELAVVLAKIAPGAGKGLGAVVVILGDGIRLIGDLFERYPTLAESLGVLLAAFVAFKTFKFVATKGPLGGLYKLLLGFASLSYAKIATGLASLGFSLPGKQPGGKSADGRSKQERKLDKGSQRVFWNRPMPVYLTNKGGAAAGAGADGKDPKDKGKGGRGGRGGALGRVGAAAGAAGAAGGAAAGGRGGRGGAIGRGLGGLLGGLAGLLGSVFGLGVLGAGRGGKGKGKARASGRPGLDRRLSGDGGFVNFGRDPNKARRGGGKAATLGKTLAKPIKGLTKVLGKGGVLGIVASVAAGAVANRISDGNRGVRDGAGGALSGAATGAGIGALLGSIVPGVGTAIGGIAGGLIGGTIGFLRNTDLKTVSSELAASFEGLRSATSTAFSGIKAAIVPSLQSAGEAIGLFKTDAQGNIAGIDLAGPAKKAALGLVNALPEPIQQALTSIGLFKTDAQGKVTGIDLAGPARTAALGLANALPAPIKAALDNIGLFKRDAQGKVTGIDLAGPARTAALGLANALPGPIQSGLATIGLFKRDAQGRVTGIDLAGPARTAALGLANALPAPIQTALGNIGLFKRDAAGRVTGIDLAGPARTAVNGLANALPQGVQTALTNLGVFRRDASGQVKVDLGNSGVSIMQSLIDGIGRSFPALSQTVRSAAELVRRFWPFSPAKDGPLRKYPMDKAGGNLMGMLADGITSGRSTVAAAIGAAADDVAGTSFALGGLRASSRAASAEEMAAAGGSGAYFADGAIRVTNPTPEPASTSINTRLRRSSDLGLFG